MPKFIFAYHGGSAPETEEDRNQVMTAWTNWFGNMGDAIVDGGNPVLQSKTVTKDAVTDDGGPNPLSGYTIISAADYDTACEIAKDCPMVVDGSGSVEVCEIHEM